MPVIYRSPLTRWFLSAVAIVSGVIFTFGSAEKWRSTPSLHWLEQARVPLQFWGVAVILYGVLLLFRDARPLGYAIGTVLWAIFTISIIATLGDTGPKSIFAVAAFLDVTVFHAFSVKTAWAVKLAP